jgi:hypothetical protein
MLQYAVLGASTHCSGVVVRTARDCPEALVGRACGREAQVH